MGARLNTQNETNKEVNEELTEREFKRRSNYKIHINNIIVNSTTHNPIDKNDNSKTNKIKLSSNINNQNNKNNKNEIESQKEDKLFSLIDKIKECELEDDIELPECKDLLAIKKESKEFENNITFESKEKSPKNINNKIAEILSPIIKKDIINDTNESDPIQIVKKLISLRNFVFLEGKVKFLYNIDIQELGKIKSSDYEDMYMFLDNSMISFYNINKLKKVTNNFPSMKSIKKFYSDDLVFDVLSNSEYTILNPLNLTPLEDFFSFDLTTVKLVKTTKLLNFYKIIITGQLTDDSFVNTESNDNYFEKNSSVKEFETIHNFSKVSDSKGLQTKISNTFNSFNKSKKLNNPLFINVIASEDYSLMNKIISHLNNLVNIS
jgi:hypothetical protein